MKKDTSFKKGGAGTNQPFTCFTLNRRFCGFREFFLCTMNRIYIYEEAVMASSKIISTLPLRGFMNKS